MPEDVALAKFNRKWARRAERRGGFGLFSFGPSRELTEQLSLGTAHSIRGLALPCYRTTSMRISAVLPTNPRPMAWRWCSKMALETYAQTETAPEG
jgi:hypothetical protein